MLSKAQISLINSLQHKKFRVQHGLFIVEGIKSISEFISSSFSIQKLYCTDQAAAKLVNLTHKIKLEVVNKSDFKKISNLENPQGALAIVQIPINLEPIDLQNTHSLLLDDIQDPGNLGTIIRTAEWFGIKNILCSYGTVDAYNPKVVQATMGSLSRVRIEYVDIEATIVNATVPVFGALLKGQSVYETDFTSEGLLVMGNEGKGIRSSIVNKINTAVTIPRFGDAESLNVAVATTVFCSEITRQRLRK